MGQERLGPSYFFKSLVLGPLNSLVWYVPSLRYTRGLGWRMHCGVEVTESSTNKQHHLSHTCPPFLLYSQNPRPWHSVSTGPTGSNPARPLFCAFCNCCNKFFLSTSGQPKVLNRQQLRLRPVTMTIVKSVGDGLRN